MEPRAEDGSGQEQEPRAELRLTEPSGDRIADEAHGDGPQRDSEAEQGGENAHGDRVRALLGKQQCVHVAPRGDGTDQGAERHEDREQPEHLGRIDPGEGRPGQIDERLRSDASGEQGGCSADERRLRSQRTGQPAEVIEEAAHAPWAFEPPIRDGRANVRRSDRPRRRRRLGVASIR